MGASSAPRPKTLGAEDLCRDLGLAREGASHQGVAIETERHRAPHPGIAKRVPHRSGVGCSLPRAVHRQEDHAQPATRGRRDSLQGRGEPGLLGIEPGEHLDLAARQRLETAASILDDAELETPQPREARAVRARRLPERRSCPAPTNAADRARFRPASRRGPKDREIGTLASWFGSAANAKRVRIRTVAGPRASICSTDWSSARSLEAGSLRARSRLRTTISAVSLRPSWSRTPGRNSKSHVSSSGMCHDSARAGTIPRSASKSTSGS